MAEMVVKFEYFWQTGTPTYSSLCALPLMEARADVRVNMERLAEEVQRARQVKVANGEIFHQRGKRRAAGANLERKQFVGYRYFCTPNCVGKETTSPSASSNALIRVNSTLARTG